jgi:hypothetical protein
MTMHAEHDARSGLQILTVLRVINLGLFILTASLAAHMIDGYFDNKIDVVTVYKTGSAAVFLLFASLVASSVGISTSLLSLVGGNDWSIALAGNSVTTGLAWLAGGLGIRCLRSKLFNGSNQYPRESKALTSFHIILMLTTFLYCILLDFYKRRTTTAAVTKQSRPPMISTTA